jgi:hypothetical protein
LEKENTPKKKKSQLVGGRWEVDGAEDGGRRTKKQCFTVFTLCEREYLYRIVPAIEWCKGEN